MFRWVVSPPRLNSLDTLLPQTKIFPDLVKAMEWALPAAMEEIESPKSKEIKVDVFRAEESPTPNWPKALSPQEIKSPLSVRAIT